MVTQPGRPKGRGNRSKPQPSPVEEAARAAGLPDDVIFCPVKARDVSLHLCLCLFLLSVAGRFTVIHWQEQTLGRYSAMLHCNAQVLVSGMVQLPPPRLHLCTRADSFIACNCGPALHPPPPVSCHLAEPVVLCPHLLPNSGTGLQPALYALWTGLLNMSARS